ncbi:hypothetical protein THRCLA_20784 [Thraustotheca clavata]|uniref:Uncharacterized protein n=1 Tax=Thraustotheca clavata TaxID=74557 RepID=A0A1W0A3G2_9STRA|nr:hypothetical protein THRCLA_20784 [Thraustotheca clavata]
MVVFTSVNASTEAPPTNRRRRNRRPLSLEQKELCRQRSRVYYMEHKDKVLAKSKARYEFNRDEERARRREIYALKKALKKQKQKAETAPTNDAPSPNVLSIAYILN